MSFTVKLLITTLLGLLLVTSVLVRSLALRSLGLRLLFQVLVALQGSYLLVVAP